MAKSALQRGILHRDLKPTNLFLPGKDLEQVKILDFGIARRIEAARAITRTGMVMLRILRYSNPAW